MTGRRPDRPTAALVVLFGIWGAGFLALDLHLALLHMTPAVLLVTTLVTGRYPGQAALQRLAAWRRARRPTTRASSLRRPRARPPVAAPRGGLLLARALASRGPPHIDEMLPQTTFRPGEIMRRTLTVATSLGALALPAVASAHVSIHPNTLPAESNPTLDVRVPNEENGANVVKVDMQVPPGFLDISTELPAGWRATVLKRKLATPRTTDSGPVTQEVSEVIWSARTAGGIPPGSFLRFPITAPIPDAAAGQTLTFKVIQTYSNGDVVRWIEAPDSAGHPAATVDVTPKGGVLEDVAGSEAGPGPSPGAGAGPGAPAGTKGVTGSEGASKGLGIAALIVGALGLLVAIAAIGTARARHV